MHVRQVSLRATHVVRVFVSVLVFWIVSSPAGVLAQPFGEEDDLSPYSKATLVSETTSIQPGETITVALRLQMDEGWYSYWKNPGDSGLGLTLTWDLPEGFEAGEIQWPYPTRLSEGDLVTYGFRDEAWFLVEVTAPGDHPTGEDVLLQANADWLICADICLPAMADAELLLPVRDEVPAIDREWEDAFAAARDRLPVSTDAWRFRAERHPDGYVLMMEDAQGRDLDLEGLYFYSSEPTTVDHSAPQTLTREGNAYWLEIRRSRYASEPTERLEGVVVAPEGVSLVEGGAHPAVYVDVLVEETLLFAQWPAESGSAGLTLWMALLFAFVGGLILNLMPCVFPVLSIKILGFAKHAGHDTSRMRQHGYVFGAGVLVSFWVLAGLLLLLRAGGESLGWGFQLQSPLFVAFIAFLLFALALNLLGVYHLGASLTGIGGTAGDHKGLRSSFFTGVLATIVATPCTAPFMGAALGFALARPATDALLVFSILGVGMALPYVILSMWPSLLRRLPAPGTWMETLKQVLAFPLLATVVWLVWVFGRQTGVDGATLLLGALMLLALALWILGHWDRYQITLKQRVITRALAGVVVGGAVLATLAGADMAPEPGGGDAVWQEFSLERVEELRAAGQPVFVDFTAAWCLTCQVNKRTTLTTRSVQEAFQQRNVALLEADWTNRDPHITEALASFDRSGVPFYVLYPADPEAEPITLPEVLTPQIVRRALDRLGEATVAAAP